MLKRRRPFSLKKLIARVNEFLSYDRRTGIFRWKKTKKGVRVGDIAGHCARQGYRYICLDYRKYSGHRLAWLIVHGIFPPDEMDHKNKRRDDNRISNLRLATKAQNQGNSKIPTTNKHGHKGATIEKKTRRWKAQIQVNGKRINIGTFATPRQAHEAYFAVAKKLRGEFASRG